MSTMHDSRTAGALGIGAAAAASGALATGFERLLSSIDERAEAQAVYRQWQAALDTEAARAERAEGELEKAEGEIDRLLDEIAMLEDRLATRG